MPSSLKMLMLATADAHANGWPEYVRPPGIGPIAERVGDVLADHDAAERQVSGVDALGEADEVRLHAPLLEREPFAAATEAGHHLVADHHDAVAIASLADALEIAVGRHEDAVGADDRLDEDGCHRVAALDHQHVVEVVERPLALLGLTGRVERAAICVRAPELDDAGHPRLAAASDAGRRSTMIAPLVPPW